MAKTDARTQKKLRNLICLLPIPAGDLYVVVLKVEELEIYVLIEE